MREGIPSLTALAVAWARALDDVDPVAARLLPDPLGWLVKRGRQLEGYSPAAYRLLTSFGFAAHLPLRTLAIDAVVRRAVADGARQLVILGAGLDARAWRMRELGEVTVFEVDHPDTQGYKSARVEGLASSCKEVRFVGVDFGTDDLVQRLKASGHDANASSVFAWEGVTMYLPLEAIHETLRAIGDLSRGTDPTVLAMTYGTPELADSIGPLRLLVRPAFAVLGEPLRGLMTPSEARACVSAHHWIPQRDTDVTDWAEDAHRPAPRIRLAERLLVARLTRALG